jgi:CheY-like chemotaxis protein
MAMSALAVAETKSQAAQVLVVDDDDDIRWAIQELLSGAGYSSEGAANGKLALDWLQSTPDVPGLILLDLMMPQMDGSEFLGRIGAERGFRFIPVALMSAHPDAGHAFARREAPFGPFFLLPKPIDLTRLFAIIGDALFPPHPLSA